MFHVASARDRDLITKPGEIVSIFSTIFFVIIVVLGNFFVMNLYIGVIISKYNREKDITNKDVMVTEAQKKWMKNRLNIIQSKPIFRMKMPPTEWRQPFYFIGENQYLSGFINLAITINTITLALQWYGMSE